MAFGSVVDQASDEALGASKAAFATHGDDAHKAAQAAHEKAYTAAKMANRPSLADSHLQQAAHHGRHVDPTAPEGKGAAAMRASAKAQASGKSEDHRAAAVAHRAAQQAYEDDRGGSGNQGSMRHGRMAFEHDNAADKIDNPPRRPMPLA